jgi:hypothetical protein
VEANKVKRATKRELIVVATMISRMIGTSVFSDRTEFSVPTNFIGIIARERNTPVPEVGWLFAETDKMGSQRPEQEVEEVLITS